MEVLLTLISIAVVISILFLGVCLAGLYEDSIENENSEENPTVQQPFLLPMVTSYNTIYNLQEALKEAGLESSNLIIGIDFTGSNESTGKRTYRGKCLHDISNPNNPNPYMKIMAIVGTVLKPFYNNRFIHVFGFGDETTGDREVFNLSPIECPFKEMKEAIKAYKRVVPTLTLS